MAHPTVGLAATAHPELDDPVARLRLPGRRPGRLPERPGGGAADPQLRHGVGCAGRGKHHGDLGPDGRRRVPRADRPGQLAGADRCARFGRGDGRERTRAAGAVGAGRYRDVHPGGLPPPGPAARRRCSRGRRVGQRDPARRGAAPFRPGGHARRGRARPDATGLPRPRHPLVDGRAGHARRALRPGSRPAAGTQPALDAAGRHAGAGDGQPVVATIAARPTSKETSWRRPTAASSTA